MIQAQLTLSSSTNLLCKLVSHEVIHLIYHYSVLIVFRKRFYKIYSMLEKISAFINKFRTTLVSIAVILLVIVLSFGTWKVYRWIYPVQVNTIETIGTKNVVKIDSNKKATQVLPEDKELDATIEDILSTM